MGKAKRKAKPSMPRWHWMNVDGCWFCKTKRNCNQCKVCRSIAKEYIPKKRDVILND